MNDDSKVISISESTVQKKSAWTFEKRRTTDFAFLLCLTALCGLGIVFVTSASVYPAYHDTVDSLYYSKRQLMMLGIGVAFLILFRQIPQDWFKTLSVVAYAGAILLQIAVFLFGTEVNGSRRWLEIAGIQFQPSETMKLATAMMVSYLVTKYRARLKELKFFLILLLVIIFPTGLIILTNLSTAIINFLVGMIIIFVAGVKKKHFWVTLFLCAAIVAVVVSAPLLFDTTRLPGFLGNVLETFAYRTNRVRAWLNPFAYADGDGYQTIQSMYAIAAGGPFGVGLGNGIQKLGFIPEAHNDIVFAVIVEEFGLLGALIVIALFAVLIILGVKIAANTKDDYSKFLVIGLISQVAIQAIINIGVNVGAFPVTGVTLPFISYGGTSLIILLSAMGIILSASRDSAPNPKRRAGHG